MGAGFKAQVLNPDLSSTKYGSIRWLLGEGVCVEVQGACMLVAQTPALVQWVCTQGLGLSHRPAFQLLSRLHDSCTMIMHAFLQNIRTVVDVDDLLLLMFQLICSLLDRARCACATSNT